MPGVLAEIKSIFGDQKSFYDILNIKKEATKADGKYCSIVFSGLLALQLTDHSGVTKHRTARTAHTARTALKFGN